MQLRPIKEKEFLKLPTNCAEFTPEALLDPLLAAFSIIEVETVVLRYNDWVNGGRPWQRDANHMRSAAYYQWGRQSLQRLALRLAGRIMEKGGHVPRVDADGARGQF
jgi:hypothetical protein